MKFNWDKYRMLVKNNPAKAEEYIKACQSTDPLVEKNSSQEAVSTDGVNTLEELQKLYEKKFNKKLSVRYKNDVEWIKEKLAE